MPRNLAALTLSCAAVLAVAPAASAAEAPATVRVLPAASRFVVPVEVLETGVVVGNGGSTANPASGPRLLAPGGTLRPWTWSASAGRRALPLGGRPGATVSDAAETGFATGTATAPDGATTALRWSGSSVTSLLPGRGAVVNLRGDVLAEVPYVVPSFPPGQGVRLVTRDGTVSTVTDGFGAAARGLNARREALYLSIQPSSITTAFIWRGGTSTALPGTGSARFGAPLCWSGPSETGFAAGTYVDTTAPAPRLVAGLRTPSGAIRELPGANPKAGCEGDAVTERGHVAGETNTGDPATGFVTRAALWRDPAAAPRDLGTLPGDLSSTAVAINARDDVLVRSSTPATNRYFVWRSGRRIPLPTPAGYDAIDAVDLNTLGQVVGYAVKLDPAGLPTVSTPVLWTIG